MEPMTQGIERGAKLDAAIFFDTLFIDGIAFPRASSAVIVRVAACVSNTGLIGL
jgi:hypothetical protein